MSSKEELADESLPSLNIREQSDSKGISYYRALHELKEVTHKIMILKNRLNLLTQKEEQIKHPISDYY